jgi:hypothetical protein
MTLGSPLVRVGFGGSRVAGRSRRLAGPDSPWTFEGSHALKSLETGATTRSLGYVRRSPGYSKKVRKAMGLQICAVGPAGGA